MARPNPNLPALFQTALRTFESSHSTFRILCSLPSPSSQDDQLRADPPRRSPNHVLVLDSSFNPPTLAHQRMAISALRDLTLKPESSNTPDTPSRILLLLAINNADKAPKPASFPQRLAMMYIFAQGILSSPSQSECAIDIGVTTEPYFHAKARAIASSRFYSSESETETETEQVYLTGFDTLIRIFDKKYYPHDSMFTSLDPFFARARLRVTMRPDDIWGDAAKQRAFLAGLRTTLDVGGRGAWADRVEMVEGEGGAVISSTKVRDAAARGEWDVLGDLVGEDIVGWIRENGLYAP